MSKIKILPEQLANQIAAGEVIERPASVVKELIENAIDAGAANIAIQIEGDGSKLIRVVDDGGGMEQDDVLLCLERHATSKLQSSEQLAAINTLGFRGEAIPSIASVSKFSITSRIAEQELGCRADLKFGKLIKVHEMGCASGTVMEVSNLFGNMPARKKFLKSRPTEIAHIDEVVKNYALVLPQTGFNYMVDGRMVLDLPAGSDSVADRVKKIVCRSFSQTLVEIEARKDGEGEGEIAVRGFLLPPETSSSSAGRVMYFVNGRMVKDKMLSHAVNEGLQGFLLKGRRAVGVIFVNLSPSSVDVNVHPTKQEVRFRQASRVHGLISEAVKVGMAKYQRVLRSELFGVKEVKPMESVALPVSQPEEIYNRHEGLLEKKYLEFQKVQGPERKPDDACLRHDLTAREPEAEVLYPARPIAKGPNVTSIDQPIIQASISPEEKKKDVCLEMKSVPAASRQECPAKGQAELAAPLNLRYVGQLFNTYILCETPEGMVAVDQHAAQERLIFEALLRQYESDGVPAQTLLFPETVDLDPNDLQIIEQHGPEIARLGLDIREFGGNSFIIKAVPASLGHLSPAEVLTGILSRFRENEGRGAQGGLRIENVLAGMACKASIKAGRRLLPEEVEALLAKMQEEGVFSHCPHGRPVVKSFSKDEVKKWFLRT